MLRRAGIVAALAGSVLVLAGCGSEKEPTAVVATPGSPLPSPSWTPPPAGMWTESDLAVGREVPPEEMDRLRPLPEVPEEPETITHNTEQGAKDAAVFFAHTVSSAIAHADPELMGPLLEESCLNCSEVHDAVKQGVSAGRQYRCRAVKYSAKESEAGKGPVPFYVVAVNYKKHDCLDLDSNTNIIDGKDGEDLFDKWFTVQYRDGKWRPFLLNLNGKPVHEE